MLLPLRAICNFRSGLLRGKEGRQVLEENGGIDWLDQVAIEPGLLGPASIGFTRTATIFSRVSASSGIRPLTGASRSAAPTR